MSAVITLWTDSTTSQGNAPSDKNHVLGEVYTWLNIFLKYKDVNSLVIIFVLNCNVHIDELVQHCGNFSALAMEFLQSCTMPLCYKFIEAQRSWLISNANMYGLVQHW